MGKILEIPLNPSLGTGTTEEDRCINLVLTEQYSAVIPLAEKLLRQDPENYHGHWCLAVAYEKTGDLKKALFHAKRMKDLAATPGELMTAYSHLGLLYCLLGKLDLSLACCEECLTLAEREKDTEKQAAALNNIAGIYGKMGNFKKALQTYLKIFQVTSNPYTICLVMQNPGTLYESQGMYATAAGHFEHGLSLAELINDQRRAAELLFNLGFTYLKVGYPDPGREHLEKGLERSRNCGYTDLEFLILLTIAGYRTLVRNDKKGLDNYYSACVMGAKHGYDISPVVESIARTLEESPSLEPYFNQLAADNHGLIEAVRKTRRNIRSHLS